MRRNRIAAAALTALLHCGTASADDGSLKNEGHRPAPGLAVASALLNLLFLPIRLPLTIVGAEFAGLSGFLNAGDEHAANDVFGLVDGTQFITPKMLKGHEEFRVSRY